MSTSLFDDYEAKSAAAISDDGLYRYTLDREWGPGPRALFALLNPSTADHNHNDPTVVRCIGFARSWGCGGLRIVNAYAYRATAPEVLWTVDDPVGPMNDHYLIESALNFRRRGWPMVAGWGVHARPDRVAQILDLPGMDALTCLGVTKSGAPKHPLYLPSSAERRPWPVTS